MALTLHGTVSDNTVALDRKTSTPLIINGDMAIAQRGTSTSSVSSGSTYPALDRFMYAISDNGTFTVSQDTDVPTGQGFSKSMKFDCTTADASVASGSFQIIEHRLEGQNLQLLKKGTSSAESLTVAFWIKSTKTGTFILEIEDSDNGRSISQAYTVSSSNTWEKKVLSFAGDTTGALDNDNARSLRLMFWLGAGSNFTTGSLATSWASTGNNRAVGQVNSADSTSNNFFITGIQAEVGNFDANSIADFQFEDVGTSLARCQRYFQKSFPQGTAPQNYGSYVAGQSDAGVGAVMSSTEYKIVINFKCEMRSAPTMAFYKAQNTPTDGEWTYWDGGDNLDPSSMGSNAQTHRFTAVMGFSGGGKNTGRAGLTQGNYTADAEL